MPRSFVLGAALLALLSGCQTDSKTQILATSASAVQLRSFESRSFETTDRLQTLKTIIATLQDLNFVVDKADSVLGSVTATKLNNYALRITVTVREQGSTQLLVRANAQYNNVGVEYPLPYQQFFEALQKAMFLTAHEVDGAGAPPAAIGASSTPSAAAAAGGTKAAQSKPATPSSTPAASASSPTSTAAAAPSTPAPPPTPSPTQPAAGLWDCKLGSSAAVPKYTVTFSIAPDHRITILSYNSAQATVVDPNPLTFVAVNPNGSRQVAFVWNSDNSMSVSGPSRSDPNKTFHDVGACTKSLTASSP